MENGQKKHLNTQIGVIRTNCLDCLDRTNCFQSKLAIVLLSKVLEKTVEIKLDQILKVSALESMDSSKRHPFIEEFVELWACNGDSISFHYTGTKSSISEVTRQGKPSIMTNLNQGFVGLSRFYMGYFEDNIKQDGIDAILGRQSYNRTNPLEAQNELYKKIMEASNSKKFKMRVYTWDVSGYEPDKLVDFGSMFKFKENEFPNIVAVGLQQIISPSKLEVLKQTLNLSKTEIGEKWKKIIVESLNSLVNYNYQVVESCFSAGTALFLLSSVDFVTKIKKVSSDSYVGWGGYGGVSIRFDIERIKVSVICVNLQENEKSKSLKEIHESLFQSETIGKKKQMKVTSDNYLILCGLMNYKVKKSIKEIQKELDLFQQEALASQMPLGDRSNTMYEQIRKKLLLLDEIQALRNDENSILHKYQEREIKFFPTFPLIPGKNTYSFTGINQNEIPAWPSRILYHSKENNIRAKSYHAHDVAFSRSRPVSCDLELQYLVIEEDELERIRRQHLEQKLQEIDEKKDELFENFQKQNK